MHQINLRKAPALLALMLSGLSLFFSCQSSEQTTAQAEAAFSPPDYSDDYSTLTDIQHYKEWGTYNVHDPSVIHAGDYYYAYSTDAIYWPQGAIRESDSIHIGNIQIRRSKDLVNWEFVGWALDSIPQEAVNHIVEASGRQKPGGIWLPISKNIRILIDYIIQFRFLERILPPLAWQLVNHRKVRGNIKDW